MINLLLILLLMLASFQQESSCSIAAGPILQQEVPWEEVNYEGNDVIDNFPVGEDGYIWVLESGHILVFNGQPQDVPVGEGYHPCGVYAIGETDLAILKEANTPQVNSWQEYWYLTNPR